MSETKMLPCPFCGASSFGHEDDQGTKWGRITCTACGAWGPEVRTDYREFSHWQAAAEGEWNTRPAPVLTPEQAAAGDMREALEEVMKFVNRPYSFHDRVAAFTKARAALAKAGKP